MVFNGTDAHGAARFYLHGLVSHGRGEWNGTPANCDTYTVYTKVASYVDWIESVAEQLEGDEAPPDGSTGCSGRLEGGACWRYCSGSAGSWCYTGTDCLGKIAHA